MNSANSNNTVALSDEYICNSLRLDKEKYVLEPEEMFSDLTS